MSEEVKNMSNTDSEELYPVNPRGTHISTKAFMAKEFTTTWWEPEVQYAWALGPAMSRFLQELKKGKLVGRKCRTCKRVTENRES